MWSWAWTYWQFDSFRGCWVIKSPVTTALFQSLWFYHGTVIVIPWHLRMSVWKPFKSMSRSKPEEKKTHFALYFANLIILGWCMTLRCGFCPSFPFCPVETCWHVHELHNAVPSSTSQMTAEQECQRLLIDVIVLCFLSQWLPVQTPADRRFGRWEVLPSAAFRCKLWDTAHTHTHTQGSDSGSYCTGDLTVKDLHAKGEFRLTGSGGAALPVYLVAWKRLLILQLYSVAMFQSSYFYAHFGINPGWKRQDAHKCA